MPTDVLTLKKTKLFSPENIFILLEMLRNWKEHEKIYPFRCIKSNVTEIYIADMKILSCKQITLDLRPMGKISAI